MRARKYSSIRFGLGVALLGAVTGCVHEHRTVYVAPPPDYVESAVVVQDDYVYYPGYQVYYSRSCRHYVYQDGRAWVSRPAPPRVSVDVLIASPSVRLDFHDAPSIHHARVVRQYPKHWKPPGHPDHGPGNRGGENGNDRGDRR